MHSQFVVDKPYLDVSYLPQHAKAMVLEKIQDYKGKIFDSIRQKLKVEKQDLSDRLLKYIRNLDEIRETNFPETFKEWYTILSKEIA